MKNKSAIILLLIILNITAYAQQAYQLDVKKSKLLWTNQKTMGGHFGFIHFNSGTLNYSPAGEPVNGIFKIDMNSIRSTDHKEAAGNEKVDGMLRNPGFFNVAKYPESVMNVKQIVKLDAITFKVSGDLTMKGITNPIEFTATIKKDGKTITAKADIKIDRSKWNIDMQQKPNSWDLYSNIQNKIIADEISISLDLVFNE
jgi:polyisoprenoid-binding protein YceI